MNPDIAIKNAIDDHGPIAFAEFMRLALYGPGGYYTSGSPISASGDYFTSPSAHPVFGALIAVQLEEMWQLLGMPPEFTVIEEGAGNGGLAADITSYAEKLDTAFHKALRYVALDIDPPDHQHYPVAPITEVPTGVTGCLLSNELLDAMPVHRFEVRNGEPLEIFVTHDGDRFGEVLQPPSSPDVTRRLAPFLDSLPDGYRGEINLELHAWAERQSKILGRGWVLAIDYGYDRAELYRLDRSEGSLRTYYQHTLGQDPLLHAGKQDITAHVDFTAVEEAMTAVGLAKGGRTSQAEFLASLGIHSAFVSLESSGLPRSQRRSNKMGLRSLVDPDGMGRFVVAAYSRGMGQARLAGFNPGPGTESHAVNNLPLLDAERHIDLTGSQQRSGYFEVQSFEDLFSDQP